jgi:hypothetical protein
MRLRTPRWTADLWASTTWILPAQIKTSRHGKFNIRMIRRARSARRPVLEGQYFENDKAFTGRSKMSADPAVHQQFEAALDHAQQLAHASLSKNDKDPNALFAMTLASGLQADYAALIEKRNLASLHYTKEASTWGQQLLTVCSDCYDAQLATGFSKYVIGSMAAPVRWLMRMDGLPADKQQGIADLQMTA